MPPAYPDLERFFDRIEGCYRNADSPGYAAALMIGGVTVVRRLFGLASIEWSCPIDQDSVFHIGSGSKPFTALLAAHCIVAGRLRIDDDARAFLPFLDTFPHPLRVESLLNHTAGVANYISLGGRPLDAAGKESTRYHRNDYLSQERTREVVRALGNAQRLPDAGACKYTNTNYFILGELITAVCSEPLALFGKRILFEPAGMRDTGYESDRFTLVKRRATAYEPDLKNFGAYRPRPKNFDMVGDSGILSTLHDLMLWEREIRRRLTARDDALALIESAPWTAAEKGMFYGYGAVCGSFNGIAFSGHPGRMDGFKSISVRLPAIDASFIYLANCDVPSVNSWQFIDELVKVLTSPSKKIS